MSNIVPIKPTRQVTITAHRVTFDLVPRNVMEQLFHTAIAVGWALDNGDISMHTEHPDAHEHLLVDLQKAVSVASQYTVPVEIEVDEPVHHT